MAVTASGKDRDGQNLDSKIASITAAKATLPAGAPQAGALASQLEQAQIETVDHYMRVGRISAANILATLT